MNFKLFLITIVISLPSFTYANDLYVSPDGSDSNSGAESAPLKTIQKAANMASAGSNIHVAPGNYAETLVTRAIGTATARIRFVSDTKWGAKILPVPGSNTMWSVEGGYTDIDGFQIDGTGSSSIRAGIYLNGGNSSVINSLVHNVAENSGCDNQGGAGLVADQGNGSAFQNYDFLNNVVHHVGGGCGWIQGIYHSSSGNIKNNIVYATSQAINMGHDDHNINVVNNTLFGNSGYGVYFGGCQEAYNNGCPTYGIKIYNNIIFDNYGGVQGPVTAEDVNNEIKNNLVYGNINNFDLAAPSNNSRTGEINADPQFVNYISTGGGNYHLKSTSPAIDKGLAISAPTKDFDGNARPQGAGFDIGAYEFGSSLVAKPVLSLSVNSLNFSNQVIGSTSNIRYVTLTNSGTAPLNFPDIFSITGNFGFGGTGTCSSNDSYAPGSSCTVSVVFRPIASGVRSGVLTIPSNASTATVALSGMGITGQVIDTLAPVSAITSPSNLSYISIRSTIKITAIASDNVAVKSVQFYVNNSLKCTTSTAPFECVWKVPIGRGKTYSLQTKAIDSAGNVGASNNVVVTSK